MRRNTLLIAVTLMMSTIIMGCRRDAKDNKKTEADIVEAEDTMCTCPKATIVLLPYGRFTKQEAMTLKKELKPKLDEMVYGIWNIEVGKQQPLKQSWYYAPRNRYRADRIIRDLNKMAKGDTVYVALTHKDVSTSLHGQKDFGIMGLSYRPGRAAVVSTYRLKRHSDLWKVTMHEFLHSMGWPHCPKDDPHCIMQDAHGKNTFNKKNGLCEDCQNNMG